MKYFFRPNDYIRTPRLRIDHLYNCHKGSDVAFTLMYSCNAK
jgi:hypothetical protein